MLENYYSEKVIIAICKKLGIDGKKIIKAIETNDQCGYPNEITNNINKSLRVEIADDNKTTVLHDKAGNDIKLVTIYGASQPEDEELNNFSDRLNKINFSILNDTESTKAEKLIKQTFKNRDVKIENLSKDKNGNFNVELDDEVNNEIIKALKENLDHNVGTNIKFSIEQVDETTLHIIPAKLNVELSRRYGKLLFGR